MMKSDTDLDLVFKNAVGKKVILNIEEPKSGVTKAEIDAAMQTVVDNNIFAATSWKPWKVASAPRPLTWLNDRYFRSIRLY